MSSLYAGSNKTSLKKAHNGIPTSSQTNSNPHTSHAKILLNPFLIKMHISLRKLFQRKTIIRWSFPALSFRFLLMIHVKMTATVIPMTPRKLIFLQPIVGILTNLHMPRYFSGKMFLYPPKVEAVPRTTLKTFNYIRANDV